MIEPSAPPSITTLLTAPAQPGEIAAESPISAQFAQLLAVQLGLAPAAGQAPVRDAAPGHPNRDPATGEHSGKPGGKSLPDLPILVPDAPEPSASEDLRETNAKSSIAGTSGSELPLPELLAAQIVAVVMPPRADVAPATSVFAPAGAPAGQSARSLPAVRPALDAVTADGEPKAPVVAFAAGAPAESRTGNGPAAAIHSGQLPANRQPQGLAALRLIPRKPEPGEPAGLAIGLEPLAALEGPATAAPPPHQSAQPSPAMRIAGSLRQLLAQSGANRPQTGNAEPASPPAELPSAGPAQPADGPNRPLALVAAAPEPAGLPPAATAPAAATIAPASGQDTGQPAPIDFARLIDRLIEARDAMRSAQTPPSVETAIAHAEFGQISLRFEHDGAALSVSLTSPDPEFTRAVQAAAPASQQGLAQDNGASAQRQDTPGQQGAGAAPGQSHSQQRSQQAAPQNGEPRQHTAAQNHSRDEAKPPRRGGIFA